MAASKRIPGITRRNCKVGCACFTCGIAIVYDTIHSLRLLLCYFSARCRNATSCALLKNARAPRAPNPVNKRLDYQGTCFTTPIRINRAPRKAASTAHVSQEILEELTAAYFVSWVVSRLFIFFGYSCA